MRGHPRRVRAAARPAPTSRSTPSPRRCARRRAACEIAELAVRCRDAGVVGFDIAGAEAGYPPTRHLDAFQYVHARELPHHDPRRRGVRAAVDLGGACSGAAPSGSATACASSTTSPARPATSSSAGWPRTSATAASRSSCARRRTSTPASCAIDRRAPDRHAAPAALPGHGQHRQPADERHVDDATRWCSSPRRFGWGLDDFEWLTLNAMKSAFAPFPERLRIINGLDQAALRAAARRAVAFGA